MFVCIFVCVFFKYCVCVCVQVFPREIFYPYGWWEQEKRGCILFAYTYEKSFIHMFYKHIEKEYCNCILCIYA